MTIDKAIKKQCEEAIRYESIANNAEYLDVSHGSIEYCKACAAEHRQLVEWLMELKDLRAEQNEQYMFIRELMDELKETKRLLKVAMEDMKKLYDAGKDEGCVGIEFKWRYADDALKLIGDDANGL